MIALFSSIPVTQSGANYGNYHARYAARSNDPNKQTTNNIKEESHISRAVFWMKYAAKEQRILQMMIDQNIIP